MCDCRVGVTDRKLPADLYMISVGMWCVRVCGWVVINKIDSERSSSVGKSGLGTVALSLVGGVDVPLKR
jgi:hypothetical protein